MRHDGVKTLLVRAPNWLGDAVMCEPAIRALKGLFPAARLSLLAKPAIGELFAGHQAVDRVLLYEDRGRHGGMMGKWKLAGELRQAGFELAVLFQNAFEAALLAYLGGIPRRYGYATDGRALLLTEPVAVPERRALEHQTHYYWNLLRPLGVTGEPPQPELALLPEEEQAMGRRLGESGITDEDLLIGLNPGSTYGSAKRWLPDRFAETTDALCRRIKEARGRRTAVLILGAKGEESLGQEIARRLSSRSAVLSGATTIRELMAAITRCALLLTNDTGPMHIASAFGVPIVAVFGPTDWRTTAPYGRDHAIVRQPVECAPCLLRECPIDHRCMTGVSVSQVLEAALNLVNRPGKGAEGPQNGEKLAASRGSAPVQAPLEGYTVFLDRDGTLNEDPGYLKSASEVKLLPGAASGLARLKAAGARLVVVTNQSGIARGFLTLKDLEAVHARLQGLLEREEAPLDAIYFCPHHPDDACRCRKPARGMVDRAVAELQIDLRRSYLVGDHVRDIQLARAVGAKAILLTTATVDEKSREALRAQDAVPDAIVPTMAEAADWIIDDAAQRREPSAVSMRSDLIPPH
ncbi:MAG TPA: lipopolysaccharide heptosyltransferase II [Nitrospira sp.]|nr:lipopolysaccharide heptosyltransferase II [Nitrospira sp.]